MTAGKTLSIAALSAAAVLAGGCGRSGEDAAPAPYVDPEAVAIGYKGVDASDTNMNFVVLGGGITNWVPERVVSVYEKYELSAAELSVVEASGALMPGESYPSFPAGYEKETEEPWFSWWTKKTRAFGFDGKTGILAHFDDESGTWQTSESYFSSCWPAREEALAAMETVKGKFEKELGAKKIHVFDGMFIAEYPRLSAMCVVGPKGDGTWSCMLDLRDKCRAGCGAYEPVETQRERLDSLLFARAQKAWKEQMEKVAKENEERIAKAMAERSLPGFPGAVDAGGTDAAGKVKCADGPCQAAKSAAQALETIESVWAERKAAVEKAIGVKFESEPEKHPVEGGVWWSAEAKSDLFDARLDVGIPVPPEGAEPPPEGAEQPAGRWRVLYKTLLQEGLSIPERPVRGKKN